MVELWATYWRKQLSALSAQAEEVRALSTKVAADMAAPIKAHVTRSIEQLAGARRGAMSELHLEADISRRLALKPPPRRGPATKSRANAWRRTSSLGR